MLYAGLAAGIHLPYECGSGTCGTCKARIVTGEVEDAWPQAAGRKYLKQAGEILLCQCTPKTTARWKWRISFTRWTPARACRYSAAARSATRGR